MCELACEEFWRDLIRRGEVIPILAIALGCGIGAIAIVAGTISSVMRTRARETTKREIAAYVAEGMIEPDKAIAMLQAGTPKWELPDLERMPGRKT